ncbi:MAG: glycosyltransferase family 4 protein [Thermodesulfobacteriota bacterium]
MKVCLFTPVFIPTMGGVGIVVHQLASFLTEQGHEVTVLVHKRRGESEVPDLPYRVFRYPRPFSNKWGIEHLVFYLVWNRFLTGFDILHCHAAYPHGYVGAIFKKIFDIPLVITSHGDIAKGTPVREDARLTKRIKKAMEGANAITALTRYMKEESIESGAFEEKIHMVPNGVDLGAFRSEEKFVYKTPYIFSMGILRRIKGFDILIKAFDKVKEVHPEISLLIGGEGKEGENLKKLVHDLKLEDRIRFLGILSGREKIKLLRGCEFYVCSAIGEEPFSNSILEAFAAGRAVLASHVGGVPDLVEDGINGILVPPGSPDSLAGKMIEMLRRPPLLQKMSACAMRRSRDFDLPVIMNRYLLLYEGLLRPLQPKKLIGCKKTEG